MVLLSEVKAYLGITGTDDDTRLTAILDGINAQVEKAVWDLTESEKTMIVKNSAVCNETITLNIIEPTSITEINWTDFSTKVAWTDYIIKYDGEAIIKNLSSYITNDFWYFAVKFNAWYSETPKELIALVSNYLGYLYSQDLWKDIIEEKLWPRGVKYDSNLDDARNSLAYTKFKVWLNQFIPLALRVY